MKRFAWWVGIPVAGLFAYWLVTNLWFFAGAEGLIVDDQSGMPIEGAIVIANWQIRALEGFPTGQLKIEETTSDHDGRFILSAWGPKLNTKPGDLDRDQPVVRIFRRGYLPLVLDNIPPWEGPAIGSANTVGRSWIDGRTLRLQPYPTDLKEFASALRPFVKSIGVLINGADCEWREIPLLLLQLDTLKKELDGADEAANLPAIHDFGPKKNCGDPHEQLTRSSRREDY